jgi:hypothetical protein
VTVVRGTKPLRGRVRHRIKPTVVRERNRGLPDLTSPRLYLWASSVTQGSNMNPKHWLYLTESLEISGIYEGIDV